MDDHYYKRVIETFVELYKEGKIYRGFRMVNWDPASKSAISDEEVLYRTVNGKLWHFRYPVVGSERYIVVATTRPKQCSAIQGVVNQMMNDKKISSAKKLPIVGREDSDFCR
jgi:valyl-tRNA synthetase